MSVKGYFARQVRIGFTAYCKQLLKKSSNIWTMNYLLSAIFTIRDLLIVSYQI